MPFTASGSTSVTPFDTLFLLAILAGNEASAEGSLSPLLPALSNFCEAELSGACES